MCLECAREAEEGGYDAEEGVVERGWEEARENGYVVCRRES